MKGISYKESCAYSLMMDQPDLRISGEAYFEESGTRPPNVYCVSA